MFNETTIPFLRQGIQVTLWLTLITSLASLGLGVGVGIGRLSAHRPIRQLSGVYVALHRNVPSLLLIIFWAFAVPNLFSAETRQQLFFNNTFFNTISDATNLSIPYYAFAAALALTLNTAAYIAELFRAGVGAIPQQQLDAARSLGAPQSTILRKLIVPQGVRIAFPTISTRLIHNMKNTALASFVAVPDFFNSTQGVINKTFQASEFLLVAAVVYLLLSFLMARLLNNIEYRYANE
ncbi:MAG: ABC transporter permease subunit [Candidatus Promineifilaceae bacterium]